MHEVRGAAGSNARRARYFCGDDLCDAHVLVRLARGIRAALYALVHLHSNCMSVASTLPPSCCAHTARTPAPGMLAAITAGRRTAPVLRRALRPRKRRQSACQPPSCARSRPLLPCSAARTLAAAPRRAPLAPAATPPSTRASRDDRQHCRAHPAATASRPGHRHSPQASVARQELPPRQLGCPPATAAQQLPPLLARQPRAQELSRHGHSARARRARRQGA